MGGAGGLQQRSFPHRQADPHCKQRLFCFPSAGAGASVYRHWARLMPANTEVCAFQPPGRESRFDETLIESAELMVDGFIAATEALRDRPFVLLGHSLGAMIAAEAALRLCAGQTPPLGLVVIGAAAPGVAARHPPIAHLECKEFLQALRDLGGMHEEILADEELLDLLLPVLRADCRLAESWGRGVTGRFTERLPCRIVAVAGRDDPYVNAGELDAWGEYSTHPLKVLRVDGDHFFIRLDPEPVIVLVRELLASLD